MISVAAPLGVMMLIGVAFLLVQQQRARAAPINIGSMFAVAILSYGCYPLAIYLALNGFYTPFNDDRLFADQPTPSDIGRIAWYYAIYFAAFCTGYFVQPRRARVRGPVTVDLDPPILWALVALFVMCRSIVLFADMFLAQESRDYLETYLKFRHLPLIAQQLLGHLSGITSVLGLALMAALCRSWQRWKWFVLGWLALELAAVVVGMGARTQFVLLSLAALAARHYLYKPVATATLLLSGVVLLGGFLAIGILRQYGGADALAMGSEVLGSSSEFEALFANAYDIERLLALGEIDRLSMFGIVYGGDLVSLIPQQLVPFEKANLQTWYMQTFHSELAERGGGLAFGAVAEGLVGSGWPDLIWRGLLVGLVLSWFDRIVQTEKTSLWRFVFFLWLVSSCYLIFRATTFALVPVFVYRFLPAMLAVVTLADVLRVAAIRPAEKAA